MRKTFAPLDNLLIERLFQPVSESILERMGIGRGASACFCIDGATLSWIIARAPGLSGEVIAWEASSAFFDLIFLVLGLLALVSLRTLFRRAGRKQGNPLRAAMQPHRAIVLLMLAAHLLQPRGPELADAADFVMLIFAALALYISACREPPPLRPGWSRVMAAR